MKLIMLSFLIFCSFRSFSQIDIINQSLTDSSQKILYAGTENVIVVKGLENTSYKINITGGGAFINKIENNIYAVRAITSKEICEISVTKNNKNVFRKSFTVKEIESWLAATIGGFKDTIIRKERIFINPFISIIIPGSYYRHNYEVISFNAIFIQNGGSSITTAVSNMLSEEQIKYIKQLSSGDQIIFNQIRATCPDCRNVKLKDFWLKIE